MQRMYTKKGFCFRTHGATSKLKIKYRHEMRIKVSIINVKPNSKINLRYQNLFYKYMQKVSVLKSQQRQRKIFHCKALRAT